MDTPDADRLTAQQELAVALEKYRVLFEHFPLGITVTDAAGRIIEANETSSALLGLTPVGHRQRTITDDRWRIVDRDGALMDSEAFAASVALREGRPVRGQVMGVERSDGSTVWLDVSAAPIPLEGYGVAITYGDISERLKTEAALAHTEQRYRALFDCTAEGIALHRLVRDEHGRVVNYVLEDINHQYELIVGLRREDVVGRTATEAYGTDQPPYLAEFSSAPLTGQSVRFETYFPPLDKHFSISVAPIGADGFATIFFDVSELRRSQEAHEKLSALVENSGEFIGLATLDGRILYLNDAGRRVVGLPQDAQLTDLSIEQLAHESARAMIRDVVLPEVAAHGSWTGESAMLKGPDGAPIPVDASVFVVPSRTTGQPMCLATVMRDIRERVRAREDHDRLEAQLRQAQKMESVGRLAGGVAHDFNNLLTSILGNAEMVLETLDASDPNRGLLADILKAGESAASLTRQLLAFSRKQIIAPKVLELNRLLANMERMLTRIIGEDVALETRLDAPSGRIKADPGQIEQIVVNLAVNAREAMPSGGHLRLETSEMVLDEEAAGRFAGTLRAPGSS
jgi:PAS domain S-box-containing protein